MNSLGAYLREEMAWRDWDFRELLAQMKNLAMIGGLLLLIGAGPGHFALQPPRDEYDA